VLHLVDPGSPGGGGCTLRLLAEPLQRLRSIDQDVLILGTRAHADLARRCGVRVSGVVPAPLRVPVMARRGLARAIAMLEHAAGRYDLIHAWTVPAAALAAVAARQCRRVATAAVGPVSGASTHLTLRLLRRDRAPILASSRAVEREYVSMGLDPALVSVLPPAVNPQSSPPLERWSLRRRWGVGDETLVVALLSEPLEWADARLGAAVIARVRASGRKVCLLVHPAAWRRAEAERWLGRLGFADSIVVEDEAAAPWRIVEAVDVALLVGGQLNSMDLSGAASPLALVTGGGRRLRPLPGIMPLLWAMSAGTPIIAEVSDAVADVVEDGVSGLLVDQHDMNAVCDRITRIHDDPTIAGRIGMNAREAVARRFNVSAFCVRLKEIYERVAAGHPASAPSEEIAFVSPEEPRASARSRQARSETPLPSAG
jgi:glycosyltransferase involved in cell wall biosynthesis